ncbi:uncharacterized protein LOC110919612 [Helianthus annuus]|uniref:uncharacterized protein LOC110919612 n=1 Tax=Helianthus annuus TaxID=4232 RepID=UPI000B8FAFE1|nr:uncharacterized protein LOC110919612 [Helianthus annuus]
MPFTCGVGAQGDVGSKNCKFGSKTGGEARFLQIHELEELRQHAYENSVLYKERTKRLHDKRLKDHKQFQAGDLVLLYNSRLRLFPGKLHSRWTGPYTVKEVFPYGTIMIENADGVIFKVNGHRLKLYVVGPIESAVEVIELLAPHTL